MLDILHHVHTYICPIKVHTKKEGCPTNSEVIDFNDSELITTLIGGDQLTAACAHGTQLIQSNCHLSIDKLAGLLSVAEDWHAKLCLLQVLLYYYI